MRALVVYESMFGNTERIARSVAEGIGEHMEVQLVSAAEAPAPLEELVDLVVVGGPTHAFSMTRPNTREDAVRQGATAQGSSVGIREWIAHLHSGPHSEAIATFDTRVAKARHLPGSAARSAAKRLRKEGYRSTAPPESFWVEDVAGPLLEGEVERAHAWGKGLATEVGGLARHQ